MLQIQAFSFAEPIFNGKPEIKPVTENISDLVRSTTITNGNAKVHTIEYVLSALAGCGIDNAEIELDASEPPIMDGSSRPFVNLIMEAEPVEQEDDRKFLEITGAGFQLPRNRSIIALPHDARELLAHLRMTVAFMYSIYPSISTQRPMLPRLLPPELLLFTKKLKNSLRSEKFREAVLDSAIVIKGDKVLSKEPLRFEDEFVRHKILDIVGDFSLLGKYPKSTHNSRSSRHSPIPNSFPRSLRLKRVKRKTISG